MEQRRIAAYSAVTVIVTVTLLSGPLVGGIDFTSERDGITDNIGNGSADVDVVSFPHTVALSAGQFGAGKYYLRVPDATYRLSNVSGQPSIVYSVELDGPETYYTSSQTAFVTSDNEGQRTISIDESVFDESDLKSNRYNATVTLLVRANGTETVVRESSSIVEVKR